MLLRRGAATSGVGGWRGRGMATKMDLDLGPVLRGVFEGEGLSLSRDKDVEVECDVLVVGGGSGGLACAAKLNEAGVASVVVAEEARPSPTLGTTYGMGGTCVNVGCVPKKLMHRAASLAHVVRRGEWEAYGLAPPSVDKGRKLVDWPKLVETVQNHVRKSSFLYSSALLKRPGTRVLDGIATLLDEPGVARVGSTRVVARKGVVVAVGGRPVLPERDVPGATEFGITSDDLFSLRREPGKTLVVGASYVALECASFLGSIGFDVTLLVRSTPLRGDAFDADCAERIVDMMVASGLRVKRGGPRLVRLTSGPRAHFEDGSSEAFDTVLFATGRKPETRGLGLPDSCLDRESGKVKVRGPLDFRVVGMDKTFAVGDAAATGMPELTPVAIRQGELLALQIASGVGSEAWRRLALERGPDAVPSTVFATPSEYGRVGLSESAAKARLGSENVVAYVRQWQGLEMEAAHAHVVGPGGANLEDFPDSCFVKLVCERAAPQRVLGVHVVMPNAGEVVQGLALAVACGASKQDIDEKVVGVHPTDAEGVLGGEMVVTTESGVDYRIQGGCGGGRCG